MEKGDAAMTIEQELRLSYYQKVADIHAEHGICLVQDIRTKKFYVKKQLTVYNAEIYRYLQEHPIANTPNIYLVEEDGRVLTVIEEYIPGDTLEEILEQYGPLPEDKVISITTQLCQILSAFHRCSPAIVNRDIKPANIKLSPDGVVKLLDLNAAKWSSEQSAKDTVLLGTQGYAAPEQYGFGPSSILTDIYSVGVLMNVMLTGKLPNQYIPGGRIGDVICKCVELSPALRYQSIAELQAAKASLSGKGTATIGKSNWRTYLPPGFRSKDSIRWLFSALGYGLLGLIGCGLEIKNASPLEVTLNRIFFILTVLSIVFFDGNYRNIQQKFIMTQSKRWWVRGLGILLVDAAIVVLWIIILNLLVLAFVH